VAYDSKKIAATILVLLMISAAAVNGEMSGLVTTPTDAKTLTI
jgi:hypothetical protein